MPFADLGLSDELLKAVNGGGYTEPTPIQAQAIPSRPDDARHHRHRPDRHRQDRQLRAADDRHPRPWPPPRLHAALAHPRADARACCARSPRISRSTASITSSTMALLIGGVQMGDQVKALEKGVDVLIATPGRLMDLFGRGKILLTGCSLLVIDEADRMLDMGFIPDIEEICTKLPGPAADPALLGDHAAADQEAGRQVPQRIPSRSRSPARPRPAPTSPSSSCPSTSARSATRSRDLLRARASRPRSSSATARPRCASSTQSLQRHGFKSGEIHGDIDQAVAHRRAGPLQDRRDQPAGRLRRRRARARHQGRQPRLQFRRALASGRLCPPHRPHRPRGRDRQGLHLRHAQRRRSHCQYRS